MKNIASRTRIGGFLACAVLLTGLPAALADDQEGSVAVATSQVTTSDAQVANLVVTTQTQTIGAEAPEPPDPPAPPEPPEPPAPPRITIQTIEPGGKKKHAKPVTWLGLAVEESSEALSAQLGLKPGEGLTVVLLAPGSPAEKADFRKNDVLVDLDGQMLVYPHQLQKLIQMHAEGDTVKLTFYRGGKKQSTTVKLGKTAWDESAEMEDKAWPPDVQNLQLQLSGLDGQLRGVDESLARVGLDKAKVRLEVKRTMEQTCKAIQDAMRNAATERKSLSSLNRELAALARGGLDVDNDATVTVRNKRNSSRTIVQTDEDGSYIIESGAKTRLTARDKNGHLLFEGEIDTPAERQKVPKEVWEKVKPMLDQIVAPADGKAKTEGQYRGHGDLVKQSAG